MGHADDGLAELKRQVRLAFPGWNLVISDRGRYWAFHGPPPGEDLGPGAIEADSYAELWDRLITRQAGGSKPMVVLTGPHGFISGPCGP